MNKNEMISLYKLSYGKMTKQIAQLRQEFLEKSNHLTDHTKLSKIDSIISRQEINLIGFEIKEDYLGDALSYKTHPIKMEILDLYKKKENTYLETPYFYFTEELLPTIVKKYINSTSNIQEQTNDPFEGKNEEVINLIASHQAIKDYKKKHRGEWNIYLKKEKSIREIEEITDGSQPIEWLGDQKQLAELLIQLYSKGWIKKIPEHNILKTIFSKTKSIQTLLPYPEKDDMDELELKAHYLEVYTPKYREQFNKIRENKKPKNQIVKPKSN